jgi:hypothetical protein
VTNGTTTAAAVTNVATTDATATSVRARPGYRHRQRRGVWLAPPHCFPRGGTCRRWARRLHAAWRRPVVGPPLTAVLPAEPVEIVAGRDVRSATALRRRRSWSLYRSRRRRRWRRKHGRDVRSVTAGTCQVVERGLPTSDTGCEPNVRRGVHVPLRQRQSRLCWHHRDVGERG